MSNQEVEKLKVELARAHEELHNYSKMYLEACHAEQSARDELREALASLAAWRLWADRHK